VPLSRLPGWEPDSWAYHGDDGHSFCCQSSGKSYGPRFTAGDIIGCGVNFRTGSAFFTKNGDHLGMLTQLKTIEANKMCYFNHPRVATSNFSSSLSNLADFVKGLPSARSKGSSFLRWE
jgi:hypothetical protein